MPKPVGKISIKVSEEVYKDLQDLRVELQKEGEKVKTLNDVVTYLLDHRD